MDEGGYPFGWRGAPSAQTLSLPSNIDRDFRALDEPQHKMRNP